MNLLKRERPLRSLFLDFNSFFASVEQQEHPELRGKPLAVAPMESDATCAIAASQEAKKLGIRCGTNIGDARRICPELIVRAADPRLYKGYHEALREVAQRVLPEEKVHSIDEMSYRLIGEECQPAKARGLAEKMKREISGQVGPHLTCSIGIAPNAFLAKIATEIEKPNGLVVLEAEDLPGRLLELKLTDLCGINTRMAHRLNASMIFTVADLFARTASELQLAFGSIVGERWWYLLRGVEMPEPERDRKSLSHSHVLPPDLRTDQGCREVLLRLIQKASARLRMEGLWAGMMTIEVKGKQQSWWTDVRMPHSQDTVTLNDHFLGAWPGRAFVSPLRVGVNLTDLRKAEQVTPSLFDATVDRARLNHAVDGVNHRFGKNSIYLAGMEKAKETGDEKIAFNKTWLFQEGKGDNDWTETFRGLLAKES